MTQETAFGEATVSLLMKVWRSQRGALEFYRVVDEVNTEIDEATYLAEGGE